MAKRKLEIKATQDQIDTLQETLKAGAPLHLALQRAEISVATYYYWVAIACIVTTVKSQQEIEEMEELAKSGVSISNVRDLAQATTKGKKSGVGIYIEPSAESILTYKNNRKFKKFADRCYEIVTACDKARSDFATDQLKLIKLSTLKKNNINPSGAMWWLERNMPEQFAKPSDKVKEDENSSVVGVPAIEVEFIDPNTRDSTQRLIDMEDKILSELKDGGKA